MEIRPFAPGDREEVNGFFDRLTGESRVFFNTNEGNRSWAMRYFEGTDRQAIHRWMAEEAGEMAGYVFLWDTDTALPWLGIAVADGYRGQGLGTRLMTHAITWCRDRGKGGILLTTHFANVKAQGLYGKMGFQKLGIAENEFLYLLRFPQKEEV